MGRNQGSVTTKIWRGWFSPEYREEWQFPNEDREAKGSEGSKKTRPELGRAACWFAFSPPAGSVTSAFLGHQILLGT